MAITSSKYIQLNSYALLEYQYNKDILNTNSVNFTRITNNYTKNINYVNSNNKDWNIPRLKTGNIFDRTVLPVNDNVLLLLDKDKLFHFSRRYPEIIYEDFSNNINVSTNIVYDNVRIYLQSGYVFSNLAGFVTKVGFRDKYGQFIYFANIAFLKEDENINYLYKPLFLGEKIYDKYVEFKIPNLFDLWNNNKKIAIILSSFIDEKIHSKDFDWDSARISILYTEAKELLTNEEGILFVKSPIQISQDDQTSILVELDPIDEYATIGAVVKESVVGDYFEIFPTYNNGYLNDFIARESLNGVNYMVINEIEVYEQSFIDGNYQENLSQKLSQIQNGNFDEPFIFRPIIKGKNTLTFSIDYTVRLLNDNTNTQIIRKASLTYYDAKKYGAKLQRINTDITLEPIKIVNKILYENKTNNYYSDNLLLPYSNNISGNKNISLIIDFKDVVLNTSTKVIQSVDKSIINNQDITTYNFSDLFKSNVLYGQNECIIYLNNFDNFILFSLYKIVDNSTSAIFLDKNANYFINFILDDNSIIKISNFKNDNYNLNLENNQLLFKIDSINSLKILNNKNKKFTINIEYTIDNESSNYVENNIVLYTGKYDSIENYKDINIESKNQLLEEKFNKLISNINTFNNILSDNKTLIQKFQTLDAIDSEKKILNSIIDALNKIK